MREKIDPYSLWLGLPEGPRPPHLYALLGLAPFSNDVEAVGDIDRLALAGDRNIVVVDFREAG